MTNLVEMQMLLQRDKEYPIIKTRIGAYLDDQYKKILSIFMTFKRDEIIELIYKHDGYFYEDINPTKNLIVCVTNKRIFQIQNGLKTSVMIENIKSIKYVKNMLFSDQLEIETYGDTPNAKIEIYYSEAAKFFYRYISAIIE